MKLTPLAIAVTLAIAGAILFAAGVAGFRNRERMPDELGSELVILSGTLMLLGGVIGLLHSS